MTQKESDVLERIKAYAAPILATALIGIVGTYLNRIDASVILLIDKMGRLNEIQIEMKKDIETLKRDTIRIEDRITKIENK